MFFNGVFSSVLFILTVTPFIFMAELFTLQKKSKILCTYKLFDKPLFTEVAENWSKTEWPFPDEKKNQRFYFFF